MSQTPLPVPSSSPAPGAVLEHLVSGCRFTEGPLVLPDSTVLFTDIPNSRILRYQPDLHQVQVHRTDTGGANGLALDGAGRLLMCEGRNRRLSRVEADGSVRALAERFNDRRLNSPNDLCVDARGGIYFTDPRFGRRDDLEQDREAVYYLAPDGALRQVSTTAERPNGVALSADGQTLYIADTAGRRILAAGVQPDGNLAPARDFAACDPQKPGGPDGVKVDSLGRVYTASQGAVWIFSPDGQALRIVQLPEQPTNLALAAADGSVLYVTAGQSLYRLTLVPGR